MVVANNSDRCRANCHKPRHCNAQYPGGDEAEKLVRPYVVEVPSPKDRIVCEQSFFDEEEDH